MKLFRVAWRNLWRNKRRTGITFAAAALSAALLIAVNALMIGMLEDMEHSVTYISLGEVQVHHPDYPAERSIYDSIDDPERILEAARGLGIAASPRAISYGLLSSGKKSAGGQFWGIIPSAEAAVGDLAKSIMTGNFLPDEPQRKIVLGRKLARTLNAEVGAELVVVVQAADGSLGNDLFYVTGILKSVGESIDRGTALIHRQDFANLFVLPEEYHEITLNSQGAMEPDAVAAAITPFAGSNEVKTWLQILPAIAEMLGTMEAWMLIFGLIFFLAAGLGVMNTMLMATYERIPEFGLLKAIGTSPWRILGDVATEALTLGFASSLVGGVVGILLALYFNKYPIDLSAFGEAFETSGMSFSPYWHAELSVWAVTMPILLLWVVSFLSALYPAVKAARIDPVKALHHV